MPCKIRLLPALLLAFLAAPAQAAGPAASAASSAASPTPPAIGLLITQSDAPVILSLPGAFAKDDEATLITLAPMAAHCCARVGADAPKAKGAEIESFEIQQTSGAQLRAQFLTGAAAAGADTPAVVLKGRVRSGGKYRGGLLVDLDGDGRMELLRSCTSSEGMHVTAWAGPAYKKRRWHGYVYLGIDVESSCTAAETR